MLSWCSYCQQFVGEVPHYDDLAITHTICPACERNTFSLTAQDIAHTHLLQDIRKRLFEAGRRNDLQAAAQILDDCSQANVRQVDILLGILAPILYEMGEDWKRGAITLPEEQRFTAFCEATFELIAARIIQAQPANDGHAKALLLNAPGNCHTLAIRILALWLLEKGLRAQVVDDGIEGDGLLALIETVRPKFVLISLALAEQVASVSAIAERISTLPASIRPVVIVGGYAVKQGLVDSIPGAELMADIGELAHPGGAVFHR
jgi:methanogenic corrinoid protein MtbC1